MSEIGWSAADSRQVGGTHYKDMCIQPWETMEYVLTREEFVGYLKGCILKYSMRAGNKDGEDPEKEAAKARHYAEKLKEVQKGST